MLERYSHLQFIDTHDPDAISKMIRRPNGEWVKYSEANERISFLVAALQSLKDCDIKLCEPEILNQFVEKVLRGYYES